MKMNTPNKNTLLSGIEFDILYYLKRNPNTNISQRGFAEKFDISVGKVNAVIRDLNEKNYICIVEKRYTLTRQGDKALEPYKVDNAIIMAAGMSSRFAPLSYEKPKGLLRVKDEILIEREICQLQEAGICDITVVVGYMKEKFLYLEEKYDVKIVVNGDYYRYNNTSTLIQVVDRLANTYICSSDNYFVENVFEPYVYQAYYAAVYAEGETEEYCLTCDNHGRIKKVDIGGADAWYMCGHVYFDRTFSNEFKKILIEEYGNKETKEQLWENLYMRYIDRLSLYIKKYDAGKVLEFDSLEELRTFDAAYIDNADSGILQNICKVLKCTIKEITDIEAIKAGLTNTSFLFSVHGRRYVYRHPGQGTENYINRKGEAASMDIAAKLGLDRTFVYMDEEIGWKISKYIEDAKELDYHDMEQVKKAISIMRRLHDQNIVTDYDFGIWDKTEKFIAILKDNKKVDFEGFEELYQLVLSVYHYVASDICAKKCLCHNDCYSPNFLVDGENNMSLIDWEYSGNDDPASDLGTFICCSDYNCEEANSIIEMYLQHKPSKQELIHYLGYISLTSYYWYIWALYQEYRGNTVGEWMYLWYKNSNFYAKKALELI